MPAIANPVNAEPVLRALFIALDQWVTEGIKPPESQVPRRVDGTGVMAVKKEGSVTGTIPQQDIGWHDIPGVLYTGLITTRYCITFGNSINKGIVSFYPGNISRQQVYPNFVSKVDADDNEIAGIRLPQVAVPIATTTGWALRREGYGENDGCEGAGQNIPFRSTKSERLAAGDQRLSLEERYHSHEAYVNAVTASANKLAAQRFLLKEDVKKYIETAAAGDVLR